MNDNESERLARLEDAITAVAIAIKRLHLTILDVQLGGVIVELRSQAQDMDDLIAEFRAYFPDAA